MTEKQRPAVEAMERARSGAVSLSDYAKAHGLVIRELYDARVAERSKFVAVRGTFGHHWRQ